MAHGGTPMRSMDRRRCAAVGAGPLAAESVMSGWKVQLDASSCSAAAAATARARSRRESATSSSSGVACGCMRRVPSDSSGAKGNAP